MHREKPALQMIDFADSNIGCHYNEVLKTGNGFSYIWWYIVVNFGIGSLQNR